MMMMMTTSYRLPGWEQKMTIPQPRKRWPLHTLSQPLLQPFRF